MISFGAQEILRKMTLAEEDQEYDNAELVCEGKECWLGLWRTSRAVVNELLRGCLISGGQYEGIERYTINEDGRKAAKDRHYLNPALRAALSATSHQEKP